MMMLFQLYYQRKKKHRVERYALLNEAAAFTFYKFRTQSQAHKLQRFGCMLAYGMKLGS